MIFGIGSGSRFNYLFKLLNSLRNVLDRINVKSVQRIGLPDTNHFVNDGDPHSELFATLRTPNRTKCPTSFLKIFSCTFSTGYVCENIGFASSIIRSLLDLFLRCQVLNWPTLQVYVITLVIHYIVSLLNSATKFP